MSYTVIIPARYASTRLPGKPLADICGRPMIERVYQQALRSEASRVIIATDHEEIESVAQGFGAEVVMTSVEHESGTDRLAEVVQRLGLNETDIVVNVQGDEPLMPASVINQVAQNLSKSPAASIATVSEKIKNVAQYLDPNTVKVVSNAQCQALYFSRAPIPWHRDALLRHETGGEVNQQLKDFLTSSSLVQKHVGIYAYRVKFLNAFVTWPAAELEQVEKLEQLRAMVNGHSIHIEEAIEPVPVGIDTPEDLERARDFFRESADA